MLDSLDFGTYVLRPPERLMLEAMLRRRNGANVAILEGPPGTGKTSLGEAFAEALGAQCIYYLCHRWTSDEEMFIGVDVGAVAAGVEKKEDAYRPGFLLRAVMASQQGPVVVIIDEMDKAPERAETLLLDFLQTGRVHGPNGEVWQGTLGNLYIFITTNGLRPLMEPTLRRGFRLRMEFLPANVEADILRKSTGAPTGAIRAVVRMANVIRTKGATSVSLQEMRHLLEDMTIAKSTADVAILLRGWLVKDAADSAALDEEFGGKAAAVLWGEWKREKGI